MSPRPSYKPSDMPDIWNVCRKDRDNAMICPDCNTRASTMRGLCRKCHHARRESGVALPPPKRKGYTPKYTEDESRFRAKYRQDFYARKRAGHDLPDVPDYVTPLPPRKRPPEDRSNWTPARWRKYLYNQWYARCQRLRSQGIPETQFPPLDYGEWADSTPTQESPHATSR